MTLLESKIRAFLKDYEDVLIRKKDSKYHYELSHNLYDPYNEDKLNNDQINEILISDDPIESLNNKVKEAYKEYSCDVIETFVNDFKASKYGYTEKCEDIVQWFYDNVIINYPVEHYLKQKVCTNIFLDTGDKANGYEDNDIYPSGYGRYDELYDISDKSSVLWLANQQGYSKDDFLDVFESECRNTKSGLLYDLYQELLNSYNGGCVAVLTEMTLQQMIDINDAKNDNIAGFVTIEKNTSVGLYDYANGGGGPFDIELEKDLDIPIAYIGECLADSTVGSIQNYTLASVYGTNEAFWNTAKKNHKYLSLIWINLQILIFFLGVVHHQITVFWNMSTLTLMQIQVFSLYMTLYKIQRWQRQLKSQATGKSSLTLSITVREKQNLQILMNCLFLKKYILNIALKRILLGTTVLTKKHIRNFIRPLLNHLKWLLTNQFFKQMKHSGICSLIG